MQDSILNYYGLTSLGNITIQSHENEYISPIENDLLNIEFREMRKGNTIVLFISVRVSTISDRKMHLSILLEQRFGLCCDLLFEHQINSFEGLVRVCAVRVQHDQFPVLLKVLFDHSSYSFAIISNRLESVDFFSKLIHLFGDGLLTPKVIKACANATLINKASFLHVLRGNDGYSVNCFSKL